MRGAAAEEADHALGAVQVTIEHDDPLEAGRDESEDDGARTASGTQQDRVRGIFWRPTSSSRAALKPGTSVLWPTRRRPSRVMVLTAPVAWASSVSRSTSGTTRSLCGMVTLAPR